jgi:hypothetical protein
VASGWARRAEWSGSETQTKEEMSAAERVDVVTVACFTALSRGVGGGPCYCYPSSLFPDENYTLEHLHPLAFFTAKSDDKSR